MMTIDGKHIMSDMPHVSNFQQIAKRCYEPPIKINRCAQRYVTKSVYHSATSSGFRVKHYDWEIICENLMTW